ncbi:hypothetical protein T4B_169 [Trichinella pseudospiralis]|uniref:Uncharacterized protein n=1 Tax=Trichinella pseudospiralis TaxID=6337 RepID=A0A0V1GD89_TRIPS|nr:hypothetical protein T4B_169 [Trichinella pseudospiralis]KRY97246.1 hypothetical protein T4C_7477 [Trichinella pseudospiralis]
MLKDKDKRSSFNGILQGIDEARSMAFYKGLSEKSKVHGDDFKNR